MAVSDGLFTYMWADHISASKDSKATAKLQSTPSNTPHSVALSNTPVALIQIQHLPVLPQSTSSSSSSSSSAQTYERITSFPDGYEMKVGEMVEGEKQYVTIVRTGKNPKVGP
jgi:ABC-type transport system involved in Fe-S cluster assembly fused permease/ATPase subunit